MNKEVEPMATVQGTDRCGDPDPTNCWSRVIGVRVWAAASLVPIFLAYCCRLPARH